MEKLADVISDNPLGCLTLREKFPKYGVFLVRIFPYQVQMWETTNQKNSVFGDFSRSVR